MKISRRTPRQSPTNLGCSCAGVNCLAAFPNQFSFFYPFFEPLKISFNFMFTPTLKASIRYFITSESTVPCVLQRHGHVLRGGLHVQYDLREDSEAQLQLDTRM